MDVDVHPTPVYTRATDVPPPPKRSVIDEGAPAEARPEILEVGSPPFPVTNRVPCCWFYTLFYTLLVVSGYKSSRHFY